MPILLLNFMYVWLCLSILLMLCRYMITIKTWRLRTLWSLTKHMVSWGLIWWIFIRRKWSSLIYNSYIRNMHIIIANSINIGIDAIIVINYFLPFINKVPIAWFLLYGLLLILIPLVSICSCLNMQLIRILNHADWWLRRNQLWWWYWFFCQG